VVVWWLIAGVSAVRSEEFFDRLGGVDNKVVECCTGRLQHVGFLLAEQGN